MTLREEVSQMIRWKLSEDPAMQRAYETDTYERLLALPPLETTKLLLTLNAALREVIFRLADEIEALKLDASG